MLHSSFYTTYSNYRLAFPELVFLMIRCVVQLKSTLVMFILHMHLYRQDNWGNESNTKHWEFWFKLVNQFIGMIHLNESLQKQLIVSFFWQIANILLWLKKTSNILEKVIAFNFTRDSFNTAERLQWCHQPHHNHYYEIFPFAKKETSLPWLGAKRLDN